MRNSFITNGVGKRTKAIFYWVSWYSLHSLFPSFFFQCLRYFLFNFPLFVIFILLNSPSKMFTHFPSFSLPDQAYILHTHKSVSLSYPLLTFISAMIPSFSSFTNIFYTCIPPQFFLPFAVNPSSISAKWPFFILLSLLFHTFI